MNGRHGFHQNQNVALIVLQESGKGKRRNRVTEIQELTEMIKETTQAVAKLKSDRDVLLASMKNIRENIEELPSIINRGGCIAGDWECIESMRTWAKESIAQAESK
jgi:hypothetical protein